jgi:hypothetical protein
MPVVDLMVTVATNSRHRRRRLRPVSEEDLDNVRVLPDFYLAADKPRRNRIDTVREMNRAPLPNRRRVLGIRRRPRRGERPQVLLLFREPCGPFLVEPVANLANELHVLRDRRELATPANQQCLDEGRLQHVITLFDDAVLM